MMNHITSDAELDRLYELETERLFEKCYGPDPEEEPWDEIAEDRALDKWRGLDD